MGLYRIDKYLADMGYGTRTEVKALIKKGRVRIGSEIVKSPDLKIDTTVDEVFFDNNLIGYVETEYYMLNKPQGVLSATRDKHGKTVIDLIETRNRKDLFCVGRLDKDTEGLLIITNDGKLAHELLSPKKHVDKVYYAKIDGKVTNKMIEEFHQGIVLEDGTITMPADLHIIKSDEESEVLLTIREGKFHQVKRMFQSCGMEVIFLKRISMGTLVLDESLAPGEYRLLTDEEINILKRINQ